MVVVCNGWIKISENTSKIYRITQFEKHVAVAMGLKIRQSCGSRPWKTNFIIWKLECLTNNLMWLKTEVWQNWVCICWPIDVTHSKASYLKRLTLCPVVPAAVKLPKTKLYFPSLTMGLVSRSLHSDKTTQSQAHIKKKQPHFLGNVFMVTHCQ